MMKAIEKRLVVDIFQPRRMVDFYLAEVLYFPCVLSCQPEDSL
jgi:hypothetical protein